jgi:hypothetical protein
MTMVREGNRPEVITVPNGHTPVSDIQVKKVMILGFVMFRNVTFIL